MVLQLFPELTDVNGDAQNARVLAARAGWSGRDLLVRPVAAETALPGRPPLAVVLGSGVDAALRRTRDALLLIRPALESWLEAGVPLLAVGTGMELLGRRVTITSDDRFEGLALLPGESLPLETRVAGDLVVDAQEGRLVGYENHARAFKLDPGATPFGTVTFGVGDGFGADGVRHGSIIGTRMHGPVLAKNPALADAVLAAVFHEAVEPTGAMLRMADAAAAAASEATLKSLPIR